MLKIRNKTEVNFKRSLYLNWEWFRFWWEFRLYKIRV